MNRIIIILILFYSVSFFGQENNNDFYMTKGKGFEFHMLNDSYLLQIDFRGQFRSVFSSDQFSELGGDFFDQNTTFGINRGRIKMGGYAYKPYFKFYLEQDIVGGNLLDFRFMIEKYSFLKLRVGQWKSRYSRERIISSGKQEAVDRSIVNAVFTIDRQQGVSLYGNLKGKKATSFNYWVSIFSGTGRGGTPNDNNTFMYMGRLQWNPNGEVMKFSGSDLKNRQKFISSIAIAAVTNVSRYTRFSSRGGGQLPGFEDGVDGQYKIDQLMFETAFKYKGFSWEQELHYKGIDDTVNNNETVLIGNYIQLGYFLHNSFSKIPKKLELFARHAFYNPDINISDNDNFEYTVGFNWFFRGHKNKLTLDYSYLTTNKIGSPYTEENRIRLQWDISIF
ncbi:MAG: OprO/OprP family phosphate-selective porin [Flavobacteriaceae bacterium]|nr:OprO/OprP family phosphate-selective porin [Flavobacteriaceae bacterium]